MKADLSGDMVTRIANKRTHLAQGYNCLHSLAERIERFAEKGDPKLLGYSAQAVAERLAQHIVGVLQTPFMKESMAMLESGSNAFPSEKKVMKLHGLIVHPDSGRVRISAHLFIRSIMVFFMHWGYVLFKCLAALIKSGVAGKDLRATLVYSMHGPQQIVYKNDDRRFVDYCEQGPIEPLAKASLLIIQVTNDMESVVPDKVQYASHAGLKCVELLSVNPNEVLEFLFLHLAVFWKFLFVLCRCPSLCLLSRDVAEHALMEWLDRKNVIENVILTNSAYARQFLWMTDLPGRQFRTHMIWYATNYRPVVYKENQIRSDNPLYYHLRSDDHWVWNKEQATHLESIMKRGAFHVVGPIIFYLNDEEIRGARKRGEAFRVAIFDVTPLNPDWAREQGIAYNYYCSDNAIAFIDDIIEAASNAAKHAGVNIELLLKHKRPHYQACDVRYVDHINTLVREDKSIGLVEYDVNLYSFLKTCDLTITFPYSSPAYIARHVGTPSIYYDSTGMLLPTYEAGPLIDFENCKEDLALAIGNAIKAIRRI